MSGRDRWIMMKAAGYFETMTISRNTDIKSQDGSVQPWMMNAVPVAGCPVQQAIQVVGPDVSADMFYAAMKHLEALMPPQAEFPECVTIQVKAES